MRGRLLTLVGSALLAATAAAEPPDPFEARVRALAHPRYAEREKAARDLEAAGEPALKALRAAQASGDEELRARAAAVAEKIDRAVRSQRLLAAPKLALKFDKTPLDRAVAEFADKAQFRYALERNKVKNPDRTVTLDTGEVPYWEAVHAFYRAAGLAEDDNPPQPPGRSGATMSGRQLAIMSGNFVPHGARMSQLIDGPPTEPADLRHALRVRALPPTFAQNKYDAATGEVTFHLAVDAAPGLGLQEVIGIEVRRAVADDRRALAPAYPASEGAAGLELIVGRQVVIFDGEILMDGAAGGPHFPVTLKAGGSRPKKLAELEGVVVARVLAPPEPLVTIADVFGEGKGKTARGDGLNCQVTAAEQVAEHPVPAPRIRPAAGTRAPERPADAGPAPASVRVRVVSTAAAEVVNFPVQVKGRLRPFVRINRRTGELANNAPEFQLRDADGKVLRVLATGLVDSTFDGTTMTQEFQLVFERPAKFDGLSLTLTGRRSAVVEMPFRLQDVPLP